MFNVLPNILKIQIKTNYRLRRLLVVLLFVFLLQLSFLIFIFPSWMNSFFKEREIFSQISEINKMSATYDAEKVSSFIKSTNIKLKIINTNLEYPKMIPLIKSILSNKTFGIHINELLYASQATTSATILLAGVAESRDSLIKYVNVLRGLKVFRTVDLPISNLAKDKNIDFSISLTVYQ